MNAVYLSGPMTGIKDYNRDEFWRVGGLLRKCLPMELLINPADLDEGDKAWDYYLSRDLKIILDSKVDTIILLPGWQSSKGARIEVRVATEVLNAKVYAYRDTEEGFSLTPITVSPELKVKCRAHRTKTINVPTTVQLEVTV